jgi:YD repeat-containing protein
MYSPGRLVPKTITYPNGQSAARHYDAAGRLDSFTDWLGNQTAFAYDANSNLTTTTLPTGSGTAPQ